MGTEDLPDDLRGCYVDRFETKLSAVGFTGKKVRKYARRIERGCSQHALTANRSWLGSKSVVYYYKLKCMSICLNLDPSLGIEDSLLIPMLKAGEIKPEDVGTTPEWEYSKEGLKIKDELRIRAGQKVERKTSTMYKCPKCYKRNAYVGYMQRRAADEGTSTILKCVACDYCWSR